MHLTYGLLEQVHFRVCQGGTKYISAVKAKLLNFNLIIKKDKLNWFVRETPQLEHEELVINDMEPIFKIRAYES